MRILKKWRGVFALALIAASQAVMAAWPDKPLRFIVPYPPGGGTDIVARLIAQKIGQNLGQTIVVENKSGASTIIGTEAVAHAAPDGYTFGMITDSHTLNVNFFPKKLPYDSKKDFAPISQLVFQPLILVANPKSGIKTCADFLAMAKAKPGKFTYASIGNGTPHYLAMEWLRTLAGDISLIHVPYKGVAPALSDVVGGQVDMMFTGTSTALPYMKSGQLVALGISGPTRSPSAPDVPTIAQACGLNEYSFMTWYGTVAPAGTPPEIVNRLSEEIRKALLRPDVKQTLDKLGAEPAPSTPKEFSQFLEQETAKDHHIIEISGAKGE